MGIKRCGVIRNGIPCDVLISEKRSACPDCCAALLAELERLADLHEGSATPKRARQAS